MSVAELQSYCHLSIKTSKLHYPRSKDFQFLKDYCQTVSFQSWSLLHLSRKLRSREWAHMLKNQDLSSLVYSTQKLSDRSDFRCVPLLVIRTVLNSEQSDFPRCRHLVIICTFKIYNSLPTHLSLRTNILNILVTPSVLHLENKSLKIIIERPQKPNIFLCQTEKLMLQVIAWEWSADLGIL